MLGDISVVDDIYIVCGYTDMREQSMAIGPNGAGDPHY